MDMVSVPIDRRDIQSYLSRLFLFMTSSPSKLVFLVDNGPWSATEGRSKPAELWQLMVTKSRASPFANRRLKRSKRKMPLEDMDSDPTVESKTGGCWSQVELIKFKLKTTKYMNWKSVLSVNSLSLFNEVSAELDGCVAFEVAWADVRGMNYVNELQADTCVALEVKLLKKREFETLEHALAFYSSNSSCFGPENSGSAELKCSNMVTLVEDSRLEGQSCQRSFLKCGSFKKRWRNSSETLDTRNLSGSSICREAMGVSCTPPSTPRSPMQNLEKDEELVENKKHGDAFYQNVIESSEVPQKQTLFDGCGLDIGGNGNIRDPQLDNEVSVKATEDSKCSLVGRDSEDAKIMEHLPAESERNASPDLGHLDAFPLQQPGVFSDEKLMGEQISPSLNMEFCQTKCNDSVHHHEGAHPHFSIVEDVYRDAFVLFRFTDPFLPVKLQEIVTADQRLLKMLESGLPPWVIFLQSYPLFCKLYRPWMRPLALTIYIMISVVTVLIGFYDLYKNVPILKATVARMFGPLFEWVESWEMVSRLKYLGTMLILQNFKKVLEWKLLTLRALRHLILLLTQPVMEPLLMLTDFFLPLWTSLVESVEVLVSIAYSFFEILWIGTGNLLSFLVLPILMCLSIIRNLGMVLLYPIFSALWAILVAPFHIISRVIDLVMILLLNLSDILHEACKSAYETMQLLNATGKPIGSSLQSAKLPTNTTSIWRATWNDLFSKVFRALRYIFNGLLAFFAALNRHRLSIYNNLMAFLIHLSQLINSGQLMAKKLYERIFMRFVPRREKSQKQFDKKIR